MTRLSHGAYGHGLFHFSCDVTQLGMEHGMEWHGHGGGGAGGALGGGGGALSGGDGGGGGALGIVVG